MKPLILASGSPYRKQLLDRLRLDFISISPDINEQAHKDEGPKALALRLAIEKAQALQDSYREHLIISSDQVACIENKILGKPGNKENAIKQLTLQSGQSVNFYTSICVLNSNTQQYKTDIDLTTVYFRNLTAEQITRYLDTDEPYDCAGSFKSEQSGIALFNKIESSDPYALIGLPLIKLITLLNQFGIQVL